MKRVFAICFSLLFVFSNAQTGEFNKKFDIRNHDDFGISIVTIDSGYVVYGASVNSTVLSQGLFLLFLDKNGDSLYTKWYGEPNTLYGPSWGGGFRKNFTNGFYSAGGIEYGNGDLYGYLVRFKDNGDTLWLKKYRIGGTNTLFYHSRQTADSGYICAGIRTIGSNVQGLLIKTDSLGNIQWQQTYGGSGTEYGTLVLPTINGGYLLGGESESASCSSGGTDQWLVRTNSTGSQQWQKCYGTVNDEGNALPGYEFLNGDFAFVGQWAINSANWYPFLARVNSIGDTIWTKKIGPPGGLGFLRNMKIASNEDILAVGKWSGSMSGEGLFVRVSSDGDSVWYHRYDYNPGVFANDELWDIDTAHGGGYVMCGTTNQSSVQDVWVIKVDKHGCLNDPDCWYSGSNEVIDKYSLGISEIEKENYFSVFPNPNNGNFFIENKIGIKSDLEIKIYNPQGEILFSSSFMNTKTEIDLTSFSSGIYFITVNDNGGVLWKSKIIKE